MTMLDTIVRFTHTDDLDGPAPHATHTLHVPLRPDDLDDATARIRRLSDLFTTVTGAYAGGDRWSAWCEPHDPDDGPFVALHVDMRLATGTSYGECRAIGRAVATVLTGNASHVWSSAASWSEQ